MLFNLPKTSVMPAEKAMLPLFARPAPTYSGTYSIWVFNCPRESPAVPCHPHEKGPLDPVSYGTEWAKNGQR